MALAGMFAWEGRAYEIGDNTYTATWTFKLPDPPPKAFAQLSLGDFWEAGDQSWAACAIVEAVHRPISGPDKKIPFPEAGESNAKRIVYDDRLHALTVHMQVGNCIAHFVLQVFLFD
jgi:hypothetical protein